MATKKQKEAKKRAREAAKEKARAEAEMMDTVIVDGIAREVRTTAKFSMRGLPVELQQAATKFLRDYESAFEALSAPALGIKVDGGSPHQIHMGRLAAQGRIFALREAIGERDFIIAEAVVVRGANIKTMAAIAMSDRNEAGKVVTAVLQKICDFYAGVKPADKWLEAAQRIIEAAHSGSDRATLEAEREFAAEREASGRHSGKRRAA